MEINLPKLGLAFLILSKTECPFLESCPIWSHTDSNRSGGRRVREEERKEEKREGKREDRIVSEASTQVHISSSEGIVVSICLILLYKKYFKITYKKNIDNKPLKKNNEEKERDKITITLAS